MRNIFITGASSYLGKNLLPKLENYKIYALENKTKIEKRENLTTINSLPDNLNVFFNEFEIDYVIHLATNSERNIENIQISKIVNTNILLGFNILSSSLNSPVKKVISAGTYSQDVLEQPLSFYTLSKQYFQDLQEFYSKEYEIQNTSIHFGDIYGPNDNRDKLIPYIKKNEDSNEIVLNSDGNGFLSPVFIEDALDSIINELILDNEPHYSLQTSASELLLVKDFVEEYKKIRKKDFEVRYLDKVQPKYSETTKFQPSTKLKYPLEKGLKLI